MDVSSLLSQIPRTLLPFILLFILISLALILWFIWKRPLPSSRASEISATQVPAHWSVSTRPLFLSAEASLFNMVRLAVQDHYLVFARLPFSSVFTIDTDDQESQRAVMKIVQHARIDIALVHPGTLELTKAIRFTTGQDSGEPATKKEQMVTAVLESAGVETVALQTDEPYSMPQLVAVLGLAEDE